MHGAAISLPTDGRTAFAMTILILSLRSLKRFSAKPKCEPATSLTCGVVEAISLLTDGRTAFAMTTLHLHAILITAKPESELTTSPGIVETPPVYKRIRFLPFQKPTPVSLKYITNKLLFTKRLL
jgi:hypothetical protein